MKVLIAGLSPRASLAVAAQVRAVFPEAMVIHAHDAGLDAAGLAKSARSCSWAVIGAHGCGWTVADAPTT
ncbi:MAG: hypothetical protein KGL43_21115, partial [Burkholderiales bacterium]|nr:hypothetical protein [Burkholderiales bacterium]